MHRVTTRPARVRRAAAALLALACVSPAPAQDQGQEQESYDCIIEPDRVLEVGSSAVGVLQEVRVDRSDRVEAGQVLALLESGVEAATVDLARLRASIDTEVRARQVTFELQRSNQNRTDRLHATRVVAEQTREEAEHDARLSALRVRQAREEKRLAELELARARQSLARRTIRSPVDGVVMQRHKSPGERVEDQPILRIAQLHPLRVEVVLPVEHFGTVRNGMRARVRPQYAPGGEFVARVTAIDPVLDAASSTFGVRLSLPNADYAIPGGLRCTLDFLPGSVEQVDAAEPAPDSGTAKQPDAATAVPAAKALKEADTAATMQAPETDSPRREPPQPPVEAPPPEEDVPTPMPAAVQARAPDSEITVCRALGPLDDEAHAARLRRAFTRQSVVARVRQRLDEKPVGYLVAVEPGTAAGGIDRITAVLREKGIRDYQVLSGTPRRVSVGYFRGPLSAGNRATRIQALGLPARVEPRRKEQGHYFLEVDLPAGTGQEDLVARVLTPMGLAGLTPTACAGIVTARR